MKYLYIFKYNWNIKNLVLLVFRMHLFSMHIFNMSALLVCEAMNKKIFLKLIWLKKYFIIYKDPQN